MRGCEDFRRITYSSDPDDVWGRSHYVGNAELAARLGSPDMFDRRGITILYDDFDAPPLRWNTYLGTVGGGVGGIAARDTTHPYRGEGCLKLIGPNAVDDVAWAYRRIGTTAEGLISFEATIMMPWPISARAILYLGAQTGTQEPCGAITIPAGTVTGLSFYNNTFGGLKNPANWTVIDATATIEADTHYNLKLVIDIDNNEYVRCIFAGEEYDLSGHALPINMGVGWKSITPQFYLYSTVALNQTAYFDDAILKIQEPQN